MSIVSCVETEALEFRDRVEAAMPLSKLADSVRDAVKKVLDQASEDLHYYVEQEMANNAAWNLDSEARRRAERILERVLAGDQGAASDLFTLKWPDSQSGAHLLGSNYTPDVVKLRRALLEAHADLFAERVNMDWKLERGNLVKEIDRLKIELGRRDAPSPEFA